MNLSEVLSLVSPRYDLDNRLEWWFSEIEIFHHNNFIQTSDGVSHHMLEDQYYMPVLSPTGFINGIDDTRCYLNSTMQVYFFNIILIRLILNIICDNNNKKLDGNEAAYASQY